MLGFGAAMEADAAALWYILHNGQQALKLWGLGDGNVVAEGGYLIAYALEGIAEPSTIDDEATGDGGAFRLIAD